MTEHFILLVKSLKKHALLTLFHSKFLKKNKKKIIKCLWVGNVETKTYQMTQISKQQISIISSCELICPMGVLYRVREERVNWGHNQLGKKRTKIYTKNENKINKFHCSWKTCLYRKYLEVHIRHQVADHTLTTQRTQIQWTSLK